MLAEFERLVRQRPQSPCFYFVDDDGRTSDYSFEDVRAHAAALAFQLQEKGVTRNSYVSVDMANCPAFIFLVLAAAYGGFTLVALNNRLTEEEKGTRLIELRSLRSIRLVTHLTEQYAEHLLAKAHFLRADGKGRVSSAWEREKDRDQEREKGREKRVRFRKGEADLQLSVSRERSEIFHRLEQSAAFFDKRAPALVLFTSGSSGRPKAAALTWENLAGSAVAFNAALGIQGQGMWQLALPLYHVGGFQIVIRSIMGGTPFICYRTFNAERLLADATVYGTTHISVVDKMLQDLLAADRPQRLQCYECVLLGGATPNPATLERAAAAGARVYASYGMTETASLIAADFAGPDYQGATTLLPGYEAQIISPGKKGVGQLAVRGPGIFGGYLNTNAAFTVDGFFLTGDTASMRKQQIKVQERINDMFVSGGENIYPAEIQEKLEKIPGVSAAFVFGVDDEAWGKRPVALLERNAGGTDAADGDDAGAAAGVLDGSGALGVAEASEASGAGLQPPCSLQAFAAGVSTSLESRLAKIYRPHHICVMDAFPRTAAGKPDRVVLKGRYDERLEVHEVRLYRIRQQFKEPVTTAKATLRFRESVIVEVIDWAGRTGLAECVAFPTDFYLPETLDMDVQILEKHLIPLVLDQVYLHPREVSACFDECGPAAAYPMAKAALEPAFWDLYGKIVGKPLWELIGGCGGQDGAAAGNSGQDGHTGSSPDRHSPAKVPAGVVLGIMSVAKTLEAVAGAVGEGYSRVKLKIKPGDDLARVRAVRDAFADLTVTLDANQSYSERDFASLQALDELGIRGIEEPIDPGRLPKVGPTDLFARLSRLQKDLKTTVFLDESVATVAAFEKALFFPALRSHVLKIAKFGGVAPALDAYAHMCERGVEAWMGGMYDTGVSKYLHAAFETLPGITLAGDLSSSSRYFDSDICDPPFEVEGGWVVLNPSSHEAGLGCTLNYETLQKTLVDRRTFTRT